MNSLGINREKWSGEPQIYEKLGRIENMLMSQSLSTPGLELFI